MENKCLLNLSDKQKVLINPILDYFTILEKVNVKVIYNPFFRKNFVIRQRFGTYPIYLPEIGYLLSLETISPDLAKRFYEETKEYDKFYSDEKIICSSIYNFNQELNRIVSWGHFCSYKIPTDYYKMYISNLTNDFLFTPSIVKNFGLISPNRWFKLDSRAYYSFKATVNYNVGIIYLDKNSFSKARKITLWINSPLDVYEVQAGFIKLCKDGRVQYQDRIFVHFLNDPSESDEMRFSKDKDYFTCFLLSLNEYETNYPKFRYRNKKFNINLIENLTDIIYSPYEIIPFLFPDILKSVDITKLVFNFSVNKNCFKSIIGRMMKFASEQHPDLIKSFEQIFENQNKLFKIIDNKDEFNIKIINPAVIPFLMKIFTSDNKTYAKKLLDNPRIMEELEEIENESSSSFKWIPLMGFGKIRDLRSYQLLQYSRLWEKS